MRLTIHPAKGSALTVEAAAGETLAQTLARHGLHQDLRCGGRGTCGRCKISLLQGRFLVAGAPAEAPLEVNSCQTFPIGEHGEIAVGENASGPRFGQVDSALHAPASCSDYVLGIDIGTTTIAAALLKDGQVIASGGEYNRQYRFGDNVSTRIMQAATHLDELYLAVVDSIRSVISGFPHLGEVRRAVVAGNTVMSCLFHRIDPASIGVLPFTPPCRVFPVLPGEVLGLDCPIETIPAISGYVGGDLTGGLWQTHLGENELLVDIGTNCEIILHSPAGFFCCAAAAGPAFEGAGISCGSRAVPGAIDHLHYRDGRFECSILHADVAGGVCGSAFIDFLAEAPLNTFGRLQSYEESSFGRKIQLTKDLVVFESDIEQLLKAKAAVYSGIQTLLEYAGMKFSDVSVIHLAGGFARYLNLANAQQIMMLPVLPHGQYRIVGNSSLAAACALAAEPGQMALLRELINLPVEIPLNTIPTFEDNYIDALMLPDR